MMEMRGLGLNRKWLSYMVARGKIGYGWEV